MASHSALTEEGRTRIRNFQGRVYSYLVLWLVIGCALVVGAIWLKTRYGYFPLQRLYLVQYAKASLKSYLPGKHPSNYILLVRVVDDPTLTERVFPCIDDQVTPVRDENGAVRFDPRQGPFFRLKKGIPYKYFYWRVLSQNDTEMYRWFRTQIYQGHSLVGLYWICFLPLPGVLIAGMALSIKLDLRINREYEDGRLVRGIRLLTQKEYSSEVGPSLGLGLPVFKSSRK